MAEPWWQAAVGYQIYPMSFRDSNGDGIGDIPGIIEKLDHLADLGIGFIWLSPIFASPLADNGYDVSDYRAIDPRFGTLADFDWLVAEAGLGGIRIVLDLVPNHTSDEHEWFRAARADRHSPYRDYYVWRDPAPDGGPPNDLQSTFGGPAWSWDEVAGQFYLHLFNRRQPDLNWHNPSVRAEVHAIMRWWLDRGVGGFRIDVIDLVAKEPDGGTTYDGPRLHEYLREMHDAVLNGRDAVTIGECWSARPSTAALYSGNGRNELSMVLQFGQVTAFWDREHGKWRPRPFDLATFRRIVDRWQTALQDDGWNSLFWSNHDLPRAVSAYGDPGRHRAQSAKTLATALHLMKGTPFVYQGEEIGMTNAGFSRIDQYRDVETLDRYRLQLAAGMSEDEFLAGAAANSRDNARTPMAWDASPAAGFTAGAPWIEPGAGWQTMNVAADRTDPDGVFAHYRRLIAMRRELAVVRQGDWQLLLPEHAQVLAYRRALGRERLAVFANFSGEPARVDVPDDHRGPGIDPLTQQPLVLGRTAELAPWAARVILQSGRQATVAQKTR